MVVAAAAILVAVLILLAMKQRVAEGELAAEFTGEVVDRRVDEVTLTTGIRQDHWLVVRTDTGDVLEVPVGPEVHARFAVGDRIVKRAGVRRPEPG
jgi:hypothetical protein